MLFLLLGGQKTHISDLGQSNIAGQSIPGWRYDFKSPIENLEIPKMYRILPFFENSSPDNSTAEEAFSIP